MITVREYFQDDVDVHDLIRRPSLFSSDLDKKVVKILRNVKKKGDKAVRKYTREFDGCKLKKFLVKEQDVLMSGSRMDEGLKEAILQAATNIKKFHASQLIEEHPVETMPGIVCWRKSVPIERVGLYIPGGTAPLFSTILMLAIPAKLAGCREIIMCTPPTKNGKIADAMLYAAHLSGVTKIFKVGGAQAIAAMAYGTESIPKVQKIFGPGNQFVTAAKLVVQREGVAIDMPAGPSELAIYADSTAIPEYVAADLLSQAEHGKDSQVLLVCSKDRFDKNGYRQFIRKVEEQLKKQVRMLPRKDLASTALLNSSIVVTQSEQEAMHLLNQYAPEHLILACANARDLTSSVVNAGSVFLGHYSPESAGDYATGTNHTLPTHGFATAFSGVSVDSFVKKITFQEITKAGLQHIGNTVEILAEAEGLNAHKEAISIRLNQREAHV